jgi:transmembrane sensor
MPDASESALHIKRETLPASSPMEPAAHDPSQQALHWFVRARSPDFGNDERQRMEAWLAVDPAHRNEFERLRDTWGKLDSLAPHLDTLRQAAPAMLAALRPEKPAIPRRGWIFPTLGSALAAMVILLWLFPRPVETLNFETTPGQHLSVVIGEGIEAVLDADSAIRVARSNPPRVELVRGDVYFAVDRPDGGGLEVMAGRARIRDIGTRFAVTLREQIGHVAVAEGMVEIQTGGTRRTAAAGLRVDFDGAGITGEKPLATENVAPWRNGQWRFTAAPLAEIATEMARQQRIILDIADPKVAALTVSGSFDINEPDKVLWAIAQVHGLKARRVDERHFQLRR